MSQRFSGKTVLVTGGNSGIGLASAKGFATEGARVIIVGRDPTTLASAAGAIGEGTIAVRADLSSKQAVEACLAEIRQHTDHLDAAFVNAGISHFGPLDGVTEEVWDKVMNINLKGSFLLAQGILPLMGKGGSIVLCGSVGGIKVRPGAGVYGASKAALTFLGRVLASELAEEGIRVNMVQPGPIDTPLPGRTGGIPAEAVDQVKDMMRDSTPMKRWGLPDECAAAVLFLASDDASYITGTEVIVDGGAAGCT